jgi:hypothetical protein
MLRRALIDEFCPLSPLPLSKTADKGRLKARFSVRDKTPTIITPLLYVPWGTKRQTSTDQAPRFPQGETPLIFFCMFTMPLASFG